LAYVHPAQVSIRAVRSGSYHLLALTKGYVDYRATFFVPASSTVRTLADLKGKKVSAPEQDSITSWMVRATLRDALGADGAPVIYTRYQDAIPFMVEQGLADAGSSSAANVVKAWSDKGGRAIGTSKAVPIKHLLAASTLSPEQFKTVQDYFLNLEGGEAGRARLERIQVPGFIGFDEALLVGIGKWLGV
jgi:ABC-type phosphate/phosphonate transport system substrate-binding protein